MSVPYSSGPTIDVQSAIPKPKFYERPMGWFKDGTDDIKNGLNKVFSFLLLGGGFAVAGGLIVAWFVYQHMNGIITEMMASHQRKLQSVSFNVFADELGKIDPEEKKSFLTTKVLCSDGFINSNPEADMKQVCVNEYYGRKRRNRTKIASVE